MPHDEPFERRHEEHRYDETNAPANPPNSVLTPEVRRTAVWTYLGILVAFFLMVGAAFLYWVAAGPRIDGDERTDASAVGTSGGRMAREGSPGGFEPAPRSGSTAAEIEYRGGTMTAMAARSSAGVVTSLRALRESDAQRLVGRQVDLENVEVERTESDAFLVREGGDRATVVTAGAAPAVQPGQRVDLTGTVEQAGASPRIHASRIEVR